MATAQDRAKALFEAEWDLEDDQDVTHEIEEKHAKREIKMAKDERKARLNTILSAIATTSARTSPPHEDSGTVDQKEEEEEEEETPLLIDGVHEIPLRDNAFYHGEIKNGTFSGDGELTFSNGDIYAGNFLDNLRHGVGTFRSKDQRINKGHANSKQKEVRLVFYEGSWERDQRQGLWGKFLLSNGDEYEGPLYDDKPDTSFSIQTIFFSKSELTTPQEINFTALVTNFDESALSNFFETGEIPDGHPLSAAATTETPENGVKKFPIYRYGDGKVYIGEFKDGLWHGRGALKSRVGDITVGTFENGKLHGEATVRYNREGSKSSVPQRLKSFAGTFKYGRRFLGELIYTDGKSYNGDWDLGTERPHGRGVCKFKNGDVYTGEWFFGKMYGRGRIVYSADGPNAGRIYDGEWESDKPHGRGMMLLPSGALVDCLWDQGKQVPASDQNAKILEWKHTAQQRMRAAYEEMCEDPLSTPPAHKFVESADHLESCCERWGQPTTRKKDATADDLPSLAWFFESEPVKIEIEVLEKSGLCNDEANRSGDSNMDSDVEDLDLSDEESDGDLDIDFDAIDKALSAKEKKSSDPNFLNGSRAESKTSINCEARRVNKLLEYFKNTPISVGSHMGADEKKHREFLKVLHTKGFVVETLANVEDYADTDEEEIEREKHEHELASERAKDTSWFTGEEPQKVEAKEVLGAPKRSEQNCVHEETPTRKQVMAEGWLKKYSIGKSFFGKLGAGSWKKRYFTLIDLKAAGGETKGALLYFADDSRAKHLGTVVVQTVDSPAAASVLHSNPSRDVHAKAERPDVDIVIEYEETKGNKYKLLLRTLDIREHDQWVTHLSKLIKNIK